MAGVSLTLLVLKTRQIEQLRRFYQSLGIELVEEQHGNGPVHFAGRAGDVVIEVYPLPDDGSQVDSSTRLGFTVENVAKVIRALDGTDTKDRHAAEGNGLGLSGCRERPRWPIRRINGVAMNAAARGKGCVLNGVRRRGTP
jgi:hypothetical protein